MEGNGCNPSGKRVAVVTGGNRGIGLEICRQLASNGITVVLTARDEKRGAEAVDALRELELPDVVFHQLEVSEPSGAACLADFIKNKFGKLDILVNNAGILGANIESGDPTTLQKMLEDKGAAERIQWLMQRTTETYERAEECLRIDYRGTKNVTEALLPLLESSSDGRIVNVSSVLGQLRHFSGEELRQEFDNIENLSEERIDELSELFLKDFRDGKLEYRGWPAGGAFLAYKASKALINAYTRVLAKKHPSLRINCVHPGFVKTDMTLHVGVVPVEEGSSGPVTVALLPEGGPTGAYFDGTEVASFV